MTDLERAVSMVGAWEYATSYDPHVRVTQICEALAAARREGAEEMRERAAQLAFDRTSDDPQPGDWNEACEYIADAIRALPLTPEEPT